MPANPSFNTNMQYAKLQEFANEIQEKPQQYAVAFLKPPVASALTRLQETIEQYLHAYNIHVLEKTLLPNSQSIWKALYPEFPNNLITALYQEIGLAKHPETQRILYALGQNPRNAKEIPYILLFLQAQSDKLSTQTLQEVIKQLQGSANDLYILRPKEYEYTTETSSIRRILTATLAQQLLPTTWPKEFPSQSSPEYTLIDGLFHIPEPDDAIATLQRIQNALKNPEIL